jgi:hypothetical protein
VTTCAALTGVFALGLVFGFRSPSTHLLFGAMSLMAIAASWFTSTLFDDEAWAVRAMRAAIICFAIVVSTVLILGAVGAFTISSVLAFEIGVLAIALRFRHAPAAARADGNVYPLLVLGIATAMAAFVVGMGAGHSPLTAYDSLSYHLYFPARWLQDHRLFIVPTPFSDEAQAYQPANGELFFAWLMLPFHGDLLARIGQVPFYFLGAGVLYMLARRLGASPAHATYPAVFFAAAPPVVEQATGANVDLICAVMFVASLAFGLVAVDRNRRRDWAFWGLTVGLFCGSKYLALVYLPILLVIPLVRGVRWRALWAAPGVCALALPWYLRNWIATGSPIYPSSLTVAGVTLAKGAFSRAALDHSAFHSTSVPILSWSAVHAVGLTLFVIWLPVAIVAIVRTVWLKRWWPAGFVLAATVLTVPLCWIGVPDNADSRFLLPGVVASMSVFALAFSSHRTWNALVGAAYIVGLAFVVVGASGELHPRGEPWFMGDWFKWQGVVKRPYLVHFAMVAVVSAALARVLTRTRWRVAGLTVCGVVAAVTLANGAETWCPRRCDFVEVASPHIRRGEVFAWWWFEANVAGVNVAYTGDNLPYGLAGHHLVNTVSYVNIDRHTDWRFDHYARAFERRGAPGGEPLASASNVLDPLADGDDPFDAPRPRFERMHGDRSSWIRNLTTLRINYLCVFALNPYEIKYVWHNQDGFPVEDDWARADPQAFRLVYDNSSARIYAVSQQ